MSDLSALIIRLEKATGPDRELDAAIYSAVSATEGVKPVKDRPGYVHVPDYEKPELSGVKPVEFFSASIDAALTLMPENSGGDRYSTKLDLYLSGEGSAELLVRGNLVWTKRQATPAIALCVAALCARQEEAG